MSKQKTVWQSVAIPKSLYERIKGLIVLCGFTSANEYIREKVRNAVSHDELKLQIAKEQREED